MPRASALALVALALASGAARADPTPTASAYVAWRQCLGGSSAPAAHARCLGSEAAYFGRLTQSGMVDDDDIAAVRQRMRARAAAPETMGPIAPAR